MTLQPVSPAEDSETPAPPSRLGRWGPTPARAVAIAYVSAIFVTAMDMHIVNVAMPTLGKAFGAPLSDVQWTVIAYLLTLAVVMPASGWIGDRIGTKRTFLLALAVFTIASALCGVAQSLGELIGARALQGIGGGMLTPTGMAMLYRAYGPRERARVARTLIVPILVAPASAPIIGGVLTQWVSWRWVFLVNIPIGGLTLAFAYLFLSEHRPSPSGRLDVRGLVLSGGGLSAVLYAISQGSVRGWSSLLILITGIGGLALLGVFVRTIAAPARPAPAGAATARSAAAGNQCGVRPHHGGVPRQPVPHADLLARGASPVAGRLRHDHVRRGDRGRPRGPDTGPPVPPGGAARDGRLRRRRPMFVPGAVPPHRRVDEPVAGASAHVLRRRRQLRCVSVSPDRDVHHNLQRGHRPCLGDLQHPASIRDRPQHRCNDHNRRRRRGQRAG